MFAVMNVICLVNGHGVSWCTLLSQLGQSGYHGCRWRLVLQHRPCRWHEQGLARRLHRPRRGHDEIELVSSMDLGIAAYTEKGGVGTAEESGCGRLTRITKLGRHGDTKVKLPHCSLSQISVDVVSRSIIIIIISLSINFVGYRRCVSVTMRNKSIRWGLGDLGCDQLERATRGRLSQKCRAENLGVGMKLEVSRCRFSKVEPATSWTWTTRFWGVARPVKAFVIILFSTSR